MYYEAQISHLGRESTGVSANDCEAVDLAVKKIPDISTPHWAVLKVYRVTPGHEGKAELAYAGNLGDWRLKTS